jgi:uncharacterized iron-regulated protein
MLTKSKTIFCAIVSMFAFAAVAGAEQGEFQGRSNIWVDVCRGEPVRYEEMLDDFEAARVIYLGERHSIERHHSIQARIIRDLAKRKIPLLLGLEQMEVPYQKTLDRYCRQEIDFDQLAEQTNWKQRWPGYKQYREILEVARQAGIPILALNARAEVIRKVARSGGLSRLDPHARAELPSDIWLDDPGYERLLKLMMPMHRVATSERLRAMVEAQMCRDAAMADTLCRVLGTKGKRDHKAIVLCGAGHVSYGFGTPERVRRRLPEIKDRIVLLSNSEDVVLTKHQKAMSRPVRITHEQLRQIRRPVADYLHVTSLKRDRKEKVTP